MQVKLYPLTHHHILRTRRASSDIRSGVQAGSHTRLTLTIPTPGTLATAFSTMVENAVASVPGVGIVNVNLVWEPAWTPDRMSDEARLVLNMW